MLAVVLLVVPARTFVVIRPRTQKVAFGGSNLPSTKAKKKPAKSSAKAGGFGSSKKAQTSKFDVGVRNLVELTLVVIIIII